MAALILYDGEAEITSDNISTILGAANVSVAPYWPSLFASFLKGGRADDIVFSIGGGVAAAAVADAGGKTYYTS